MSRWDASSENTQSFGVPEPWNPAQEPPESADFPASASPGTPPDIFLQDYDSNDFAPSDFAPNEFPRNDFPSSDFAPNGVGRHAAPPHRDNGHRDNGRQDNGRQDNGHRDNGHRGRPQQDPLQRDPAPWERDQQDYPGQDFRAPELPQRPQLTELPERTEPPQRLERPRRPERPQRPERLERLERLDRPDPAGRGYGDSQAYREPEQAARVDPALRDFFAPPPPRPDSGRQAPGQQRHGAAGNGYAGQSREPWGPPPDDRGPFQDAPAPRPGPRQGPRPGSRSGHRQEAPPRRAGLTVLVAVAVVVVIGIGVGAYMLLHRGNSTPQSTGGGTPTTPASSPAPTPSAPAPPAKTVGYTLTTPARAGGYPKLATIPSAVHTAASPVSEAVENAAVTQDGGKVTGKVSAAYQLTGGQVLAFTGYKGTFNPAKVMASLATLGTDSHQGTAGPHGGMLACASAPGSPSGTVCVWVTTTTLGVTEFFSSTGPEVVTDQAKAAEDTLNFRNSVEQPK